MSRGCQHTASSFSSNDGRRRSSSNCCLWLRRFVLFSLCRLALLLLLLDSASADVQLVALVPPTAETDSYYFPQAAAISTVLRLAAEDINEDGSLLSGNVSISLVVAETGASEAAAALCSALTGTASSVNSTTVAVLSTLGASSASFLGSLSNSYMHLPLLTVGASAARSEGRDSSTGDGGYLLGVQPDIYPQMEALVRLILDMKTARDAADGRSETTERVFVLHTNDAYGSTAATAFAYAARNVAVDLVNSSEDTDDDDEGEADQAMVEISTTVVLPASAGADFSAAMAELAAEEASIIVLLAEGHDGGLIRAVFKAARGVGLVENVQWYLPDPAAKDSVFDANSTYRDAELAYDMRGLLGVRPCTPLTGTGAVKVELLTSVWQNLDPVAYPGAGPGTLNADDRIDYLLAYAYDAVYVAAAAAGAAQEEASGGAIAGFVPDLCPFPSDGPWDLGATIRDAIYSASASLTGATGPLTMLPGEGDADGEEADGRDAATTTFCAVNLRPHGTLGGRFELISTLDGGEIGTTDSEGYQAASQYQADQTYPAGASTYPFDKPVLSGRHIEVVVRRSAAPFVFVAGDGTSLEDFTGITPMFLESLAQELEFTYTLTAPAEGVGTSDTVDMVRNGTKDMAASWITITEERSGYVSFTYPYHDLGIAFVYKITIDEGVDLWKAFTPFEPELWLAVFLALILTVFLLWLFEGAKNDQFSHGNWGNRRRTVSRGLSRSVYVTASLMMSQLTHKPETLEGYLLTLGWLFASFVLAASYTAELASFLTATRLSTTTLSVDGLKNGDISHSSVALLQGGNTQYLYERDFLQCDSEWACGNLTDQPQKCYSTFECLSMVLNGSALTALADSPTAEYELQNDFCGLAMLSDILYPQHYGLVLPLDSPLTEEFKLATLRLREDGTLTEHAEVYLGNEANCPSIEESDGSTNMTIADVSGVFLVLGVFIGLSVLSWLMRRSPPAKKRKARQMAQRKLNSPQGEDNVTATFAKLSRRQQKSFAFEAAVKLLAETEAAKSGRPNGSSASGISRTDADVEAGAVCGDTSAEDSERRRSRETAREIAAGRPVLRIGGGRQSERDSGIRQRYRRTDRLGDVGPRGRVSDDNAGSGLDVARVRRPRGGGAGDDLVNVGPMLGFNTSSIRGDVFPDSSGWDLRRANNNGRRVGPMLGFNTSSVRGDLSPDSPRWDLRRARNNGSRHGVMALLRRLFSAKSQRSSPSPAAEGLPASRDHIGHSPATAHDATAVTAAASKWLARRTAPVQLSTSSSAADFARVEGDPPPVGAALAAADAIVRGDDTASSSVANSGSGLSRPPGTVAAAPAESSGGKVLASERASMAGATSTADGMPGMPSGDATVTTVEGQKGLNTITTSVPGLPTPASPPTPSADAAATAARAATGSPREEVDVATAR